MGTRFSHFAEEQKTDIVNSVILGVKRAFEDSEAGTIASKISSSREGDLRKKILPIYSKCPFYGSPADACDAAHIIPYSYANHPLTSVSLVLIQHTWESVYRIHCSIWEDGIQDEISKRGYPRDHHEVCTLTDPDQRLTK